MEMARQDIAHISDHAIVRNFQPLRAGRARQSAFYCWRSQRACPVATKKREWNPDVTIVDLVRIHPRAEIGTRLCGSISRILALLAGAGIDLRRP